ncbi:NUDIX hydrolase [Sphingobium sp. B11D3A]|uniref:NUDIX hydrolase n=1 Tax=Sphingobium sp. B11D3A TaxID=2940574 RepID=UPI002223F98E|nr:NUDIX domain-containing protein [Sphingobium sp. B11D3A]MCW2392311.1 8-oxo-dGTP pyrophosphatase MutT (NUDIX family) [Sphingobium sp. B11D3A]
MPSPFEPAPRVNEQVNERGVTRRAKRPAARLLVTDPQGRLLLFRFTPDDRPPFWVTPGGAVDRGETFEQAARRELREETGLDLEPGPLVAVRDVTFVTLEGIPVDAEERFYAVPVAEARIDTAGHTDLEKAVMLSHRWWTPQELAAHDEAWYPVDLLDIWQELLAGTVPS